MRLLLLIAPLVFFAACAAKPPVIEKPAEVAKVTPAPVPVRPEPTPAPQPDVKILKYKVNAGKIKSFEEMRLLLDDLDVPLMWTLNPSDPLKMETFQKIKHLLKSAQ